MRVAFGQANALIYNLALGIVAARLDRLRDDTFKLMPEVGADHGYLRSCPPFVWH